ncbi:MAG: DUF2263 domain-containing protein [bacterium]|nr:DUF2263 domain-containing protein [bacterium]
MPGRRLTSEDEAASQGFDRAARNLERWREARRAFPPPHRTVVFAGDWGMVTQALTRRYGGCFAALDMANAFVPGGGYVEGMTAQEGNMFRRTDCHLRIDAEMLVEERERYRPALTSLISGEGGRVYLDTGNPRVCIRGPEDRGRDDLGYAWLEQDEVFLFYELRTRPNGSH